MIENWLPGRKTSLFMSLLILGLASGFLAWGKIGSAEWMTVSVTVLGMYATKRYHSEKVHVRTGQKEP